MNFMNRHKFDILLYIYISILFIAIDEFYTLYRFSIIGGITQDNLSYKEHFRQFIFIAEFLLAFSVLFFCTKIKKAIGLPLLLILWVLFFVELAFHIINGKPVSLLDIDVLNSVSGGMEMALVEYSSVILKAAIFTSLLFAPLVYKSLTQKLHLSSFFVILPLSILSIFYGIILASRGEVSVLGFPKGFAYAFGSLSLTVNKGLNNLKTADKFEVLPTQNPKISKIIVVIDESIDYESFKLLKFKTTDGFYDFGKTKSGANCSAASNFILRKGAFVRNSNHETGIDFRNVESLFSLAQKGGYKTAYLDNPSNLSEVGMQLYFDKFELNKIDSVIKYREKNGYKVDKMSIKDIQEQLKNEKIFIITNKIGAHFPYEDMIPPELRVNDRLANYKTALELSTRDYLDELYSIIDDQTVILYTSDHGQNLNARTTHCSTGKETEAVEYSVPMMVITKNEALKIKFQASQILFQNKASHIELSETARNLMGFEVEELDSLIKQPKLLNVAFCGIYGSPQKMFGMNPRCKSL